MESDLVQRHSGQHVKPVGVFMSDRSPFAPDPATDHASEDIFARAVEAFGGYPVRSLLASPPTGPNADWAFPAHRVIIEHKQLEADFRKAPAFREREMRLRSDYASKGKADIFGRPHNRRQFERDYIRLYHKPVGQILRKARAQIRATKDDLGWSDAKGVVVVSNRHATELLPLACCMILEAILNADYPEIDGIIYVTNYYVETPGSDLANILWCPVYRTLKGKEPAGDLIQFVDEFGATFFQVNRQKHDVPQPSVKGGSAEALNAMRSRPIFGRD